MYELTQLFVWTQLIRIRLTSNPDQRSVWKGGLHDILILVINLVEARCYGIGRGGAIVERLTFHSVSTATWLLNNFPAPTYI